MLLPHPPCRKPICYSPASGMEFQLPWVFLFQLDRLSLSIDQLYLLQIYCKASLLTVDEKRKVCPRCMIHLADTDAWCSIWLACTLGLNDYLLSFLNSAGDTSLVSPSSVSTRIGVVRFLRPGPFFVATSSSPSIISLSSSEVRRPLSERVFWHPAQKYCGSKLATRFTQTFQWQ